MNQSLHKVDQGLRRSGVEEAIIKREKLMESHHMEEYSSCFLELDLLPLLVATLFWNLFAVHSSILLFFLLAAATFLIKA